ncbi:hypothetical protein [Halobacterium wangiae]|uniref:hypothetical protein n=1 Tax=Halobacterium wangiae TaxID=2902623 RepID=UPI001E36F7CD|nr:hypothetical protein [Halobacterium wangiae]
MTEDTPADASGDAETTTAATRYRWTNDLLAGIIVLAHVTLIASAVFGGVSVPKAVWDVFAVEVLLATVWAFGRETVGAVDKLRGGGGSS